MNPLRGDIDFTVDDKTYLLTLDVNAWCPIEDRLDQYAVDIVGHMLSPGKRVKLSFLRTVFWGALLEHQPGMTLKEAGKLIGRLTAGTATTLLQAAIIASFPETGDADEEEGTDGPQARSDDPGTG